jgi:hypothetical protein
MAVGMRLRKADVGTLFLAWLGFLCLFGPCQRAQAQTIDLLVESSFSTSEAILGRTFKYTIAIRKGEGFSGTLASPMQPNLPPSSVLVFGRFQRNEQYQSASGEDPVGVSLEFDVVAKSEGKIVMPGFVMNYMGRELLIPPAVVHVRSPVFETIQDEVQWLSFEFSEFPKELRAGERYRTSLELYVFHSLQNVTFSSPVPAGSDFSLDKIAPGPTERVITRGQYRYRVFSWPLTFTVLRSGEVSIGFRSAISFRIPANRLEFVRASRAANVGGSAVIEELMTDSHDETVTVFTPARPLRVVALPDTSGLTGFYQGIGTFTVSVGVENDRVDVGQPINLTMVVEGEGNFGSFRTPSLMFDNRWRVFPPQEIFEDLDFLGFKGRQTYRFVAIPLSPEVGRIPSIPYTYFDTSTGSFKTFRSEPIPLHFGGDSLISGAEILDVRRAESADETPQKRMIGTLHWSVGTQGRLGEPFFQTRLFWALQTLLGLGLFLWYSLRVKQLRWEQTPELLRKHRLQRQGGQFLKMAKAAAKEHDGLLFYEAAFLSLAAIFAARSGVEVESVTTEALEGWLREIELNESFNRVVLSYLSHYEVQRFSQEEQAFPPLVNEFQRLKSIVSKLKKVQSKGGWSRKWASA